MTLASIFTAANIKSALAIGAGIAVYYKFVKPFSDKYLPGT